MIVIHYHAAFVLPGDIKLMAFVHGVSMLGSFGSFKRVLVYRKTSHRYSRRLRTTMTFTGKSMMMFHFPL